MRFLFRHKVAATATLLALGTALGAGGAARADDNLYAVAKIAVDITAKDAVVAKETGMAQAEEQAVRTVLKRLLPPEAYAQLPELSQDDIEGMVLNVSFRGEQNSTTRYIATLDVNLNEAAVKQLLAAYSLPYNEARAPRIKILPVVFEGDAVKREGGSGWRQAWTTLDFANSVTPADLVELRPSLDGPTLEAILAGDKAAYAKFQGEYGDAPLVIAVGEGAAGSFTTRLVGADSVGEINFGQTDKMQGDIKTAARDAAVFSLGVLENRWKVMQSGGQSGAGQAGAGGPQQARGEEGGAPATPQGEPERNVVAVVEFSGLKEWQDIRSKLVNVAGIEGLEVNALSARTASVTFDYAGSLGRLQKELDRSGFVFENRADNFVIRAR
jgi:hypothetical protein